MEAISKVTNKKSSHADERGAALITMLLISLLLLTAGGALIMTTSMSATNTVDAAAEIQAYYAAESGTQAVLNIFRGNVAPNPVFATDPFGEIADANKISFRKAVTV
jgi:flagellar basal body-associated protein FliL